MTCEHDDIQTTEDHVGNVHTYCAKCGVRIGLLRRHPDDFAIPPGAILEPQREAVLSSALTDVDRRLQIISSIADDLNKWGMDQFGASFIRRQASRLAQEVQAIDAALFVRKV